MSTCTARVLAKNMDGAWKVLDHMKSASIAVNAMSCSIQLKHLMAHSLQRDINRVCDLVLETEDNALLSCAVEVNARGLQPGPVTSECMTEVLVMNGQPDEALELIHRHAELLHQHRDLTTVLKASPRRGVPRTSSARARR